MGRGDADEATTAVAVASISTAPQSGSVNEPFFNVPNVLSDLIVVFSASRLPTFPTQHYYSPVLSNYDPKPRYLSLTHQIQAIRVRVTFYPVIYSAVGTKKR